MSEITLSNAEHNGLSLKQKLGLVIAMSGILTIAVAGFGANISAGGWTLGLSLTGIFVGVAVYAHGSENIGVNGVWHKNMASKGVLGWMLGVVLTGFYVLLYWFPQYLGLGQDGASNTGLVAFFDPLSRFFKGQAASQWFVYGTLYTLAIVAMGYKFILKYKHNKYQRNRTLVVMACQLFFAYLIPEILEGLNSEQPYFAKDIKNMWPLNYYFFDSWHLNNMRNGGSLGMFYLTTGIAMFAVVTPIVTYYVGKRWYCSWVCGCGGLAETAGDSFRHLSSKKLSAWKLERWLIHGVLVFSVVMTAAVLYGYFFNTDNLFGLSIYHVFREPYGFLIGAAFSGVIGVGFYPILGSRVWCRFGCPLAAYMGIIQRFKSRFRITTNGGQCISCGNCSTHCEMGIDVRSYAQRGENIVRASCVGCGICADVCPRGVLKLENKEEEGRFSEGPIVIKKDGIKLNV